MSKDIIIQQSGFPEALTVDALRTSKQGSGSEDWLPAEGKNLVELDIGGSGTYRASDYSAYGIAVARVAPKYGGGATFKAAQQPEFGNLHIISIQEGGQPVLLSARLVKVNQQGGGTCLWVPEDEVNLVTKYVDHSGTYRAIADNCYGYSQITVSGVDVEVTQDEDGDDVAEITDGGETITQKLPYSIVVVTPPAKIDYNDGETINFTGIVVKAYIKSGALWTDQNYPNGIIPFAELIFPKTIAEIAFPTAEVSYDLSPLPNPLAFTSGYSENRGEYTVAPNHYVYSYKITPVEGKTVRYFGFKLSESDVLIRPFFASDTRGEAAVYIYERVRTNDGAVVDYNTTFVNTVSSYTYNGKTVYYWVGRNSAFGGEDDTSRGVPVYLWPNNTQAAGPVAWALIYGDISGGASSVPVQWNRPYDHQTLESSFDINVSPSNQEG